MSPAHLNEAHRLYEQIRRDKKAWLPWRKLPIMVQQAWTIAIFLSALSATGDALPKPSTKAAPLSNAGPPTPDKALMNALQDGG